jgi:hypothetical protein
MAATGGASAPQTASGTGAAGSPCEDLCARMPAYTQKCAGSAEAPPDCMAGCAGLPPKVHACVQAMDCSPACMACVQDPHSDACAAPAGGAAVPAPQIAITWAGTWNVQVKYQAECDVGMGSLAHGEQDFTAAVALSGPNDNLQADAAGYVMRGTGDGATLTLSGQFPVRDHKGNQASNVAKTNNVTLKVTQVTSSNSATGSIEGAFTGKFGFKCKVKDGVATLTR